MKKQTIPEQIRHETGYIEFLEKRLNSENYKKNVSSEEYSATELKLKKARFRLKLMKM